MSESAPVIDEVKTEAKPAGRAKKKPEAKPAASQVGNPPANDPPAEALADEQPQNVCKACGCPEFDVIKKLPDFQHSGQTVDGRTYNKITRRTIRCKKCGQVRMDTGYLLD